MTIVAHLENFVGVSGHTADEKFNSLVLSLETYARVIDEEEEAGTYADFISTTYQDIVTGVQYELWYQVRTPDSPKGMEYAYGFQQLQN
jgi:hypothetical protein